VDLSRLSDDVAAEEEEEDEAKTMRGAWKVARVCAIAANGICVVLFGTVYGYILSGAEGDSAWDVVSRATLFYGTMLTGPVLSTIVMLWRPKPS
jgi:hypothetical protein